MLTKLGGVKTRTHGDPDPRPLTGFVRSGQVRSSQVMFWTIHIVETVLSTVDPLQASPERS